MDVSSLVRNPEYAADGDSCSKLTSRRRTAAADFQE